MKRLKDLIVDYLKTRSGYVHSNDIHNYVCEAGYLRSSSARTLGKMAKNGEVLSSGKARYTAYRLNPKYQPSDYSVFQQHNHAHLVGGRMQPKTHPTMKKANIATNGVFDYCRQSSRVYVMDSLLREVRNAATS